MSVAWDSARCTASSRGVMQEHSSRVTPDRSTTTAAARVPSRPSRARYRAGAAAQSSGPLALSTCQAATGAVSIRAAPIADPLGWYLATDVPERVDAQTSTRSRWAIGRPQVVDVAGGEPALVHVDLAVDEFQALLDLRQLRGDVGAMGRQEGKPVPLVAGSGGDELG